MLTKEEHDAWFTAVTDILRDCRVSINNWKRIGTPENRHEHEFQQHGFTRHLVHHYWFTLVTQLNKLLYPHVDNETSFQAIFRRYFNDTLDPFYQGRLDANLPQRKFWYGLHLWGTVDEMKDGIKKQNARISDPVVQKAIAKVHAWRNKATAHRDLERPTEDVPSFEELEMLTKLADEIFRMVRAGFGYPDEDTLVGGLEVGLVMRMWKDGHLFHKLEKWLLFTHQIDLRPFIDKLPD